MASAAIVMAIALVCLVVFFIMETQPKKTMSMLDLSEFKDLPAELRTMLRTVLPNPGHLKKQWATLTPHQKHAVMHQISAQFPKQPQPPPNLPPAPSVLVKPAAAVIKREEDEDEDKGGGLKPGFLLSESVDKRQKKNTKNKKQDKIVTLGDIGTPEDDLTIVVSGDDV